MSYVIATPEMMATAAFDLARIGSQVSAASAVAAMPTTEVVAAGATRCRRASRRCSARTLRSIRR